MATSASRIAVWGAGGHGRVVADLVRALGHVVAGGVDADPTKLGQRFEPGGAVVRWAEDLIAADGRLPDGVDAVALGLGDNVRRARASKLLGAAMLPVLVHPGAHVSPSAILGAGTVVFAGAVINAAAQVGAAAIINSNAVVEHDCRVGEAAHVSPGAILTGGASVGARAWVGAGAVVLPGVVVGDDAIVGAGAVVTRDVRPGATVVGNPARERKADTE